MQITILKQFGRDEYTLITEGEEGAGFGELRCEQALQWDELLPRLVRLLVPRCSDGRPVGRMPKLFLAPPKAQPPDEEPSDGKPTTPRPAQPDS